MAIFIHSEGVNIPSLNKSKIKGWITKIIEYDRFILGEINIIFVNNDYILNINKEFLSHDYYTDIITFDYCEKKTISGDLFLSIEMIEENALNLKIPYIDEIKRVIIHGVLHLMGFTDKTENDSKIMREKENQCLKKY